MKTVNVNGKLSVHDLMLTAVTLPVYKVCVSAVFSRVTLRGGKIQHDDEATEDILVFA